MITAEQNVIANSVNIAGVESDSNAIYGVLLGLAISAVSFAFSFTVSRLLHLTAGSCPMVPELGLATTVLGVLLAYDARKSVKDIITVTVGIFTLMGVFVSLTL